MTEQVESMDSSSSDSGSEGEEELERRVEDAEGSETGQMTKESDDGDTNSPFHPEVDEDASDDDGEMISALASASRQADKFLQDSDSEEELEKQEPREEESEREVDEQQPGVRYANSEVSYIHRCSTIC